MNPFRRNARADAAWHPVGLASSFPDLGLDNDGSRIAHRCKAFIVPKLDGLGEPEAPVEADIDLPGDMKDQIIVFKYKGNFHAIDHQCPHSSFPLSQGSLFDIEDFGIVLSAGLTCPKHGWSFDIFSGRSDRGSYKLKVWEVQLRDPPTSTNEASESSDKEVWVRRKQRIG
ncbi:Rieske domain-containing protein [Tolypocladium paradoxum]|uniref:Rieske domain-containing protein n=1 Tax=Tolypocladium paradoxum TaxID=94208 RepID=A0A2S4KYG2_9HYPO|nr:Rieske domain-containing protein [Tolypocladium paradoxum]